MLPGDPVMCLSVVNTRLRDEFDSLDELCSAMDEDKDALCERLNTIDYHYDSNRNQFI